MPKSEWFHVDVITCAAPYIAKRKYTNKTALKELFKGRIKNIFEVAIDNEVEVIILGAFGCGAFKNPPEVVAKTFHEMIEENNYGNYFKKIVFAIKSNYSNNDNYDIFSNELYSGYIQVKLSSLPSLPLLEPLRARCDEFNDFMDYQSWKNSNRYYGKQFSILGDSISTLAGYNPKDYKVFYADENCEKSGVKEMQDTWFGKVIDFFGGELLVNNSWSGSRVTRLPNNENLFPSGCSDERTGKLHINNVKPDVVMVYLGTNDWAFGTELDGTRLLIDKLNMQYFTAAYETMLEKTKTNYPNAEIWCCTLNTTFMSSNPSFNFPYKYGGTHIEEYNQIIKDTADINNCKIIDLYSYHIPYDSIDGSHPNADGMNTLATFMIREIGEKEVKQFMDFENKKYIEEVKSILCLHCGKTIKYSDNFCEYCGKALDGNSKFNICPHCNRRTLIHTCGSDYCTSCGFEMVNFSPYIWNSLNMNIEDLKSFEISFGNCPIFHISYDGEKLTVYNRHNPRDGWMSFPDGFFDDKIVNLTDEQKARIIDFIKTINFEVWKTEDYIRKNYEMSPVGFYISNSLIVTFKNDKCFKCFEPKYKEFDELIEFLKKFCNNDWFKPYYDDKSDVEKETILLFKNIYDSDAQYVHLPLDMTRLLFDNTLILYDTDTNQNIEIQNEKIDVGRSPDCEFQVDNNYISQIHASFYHEDSCWFIMDKGSRNGTWLNGKKLENNIKYELYPGDNINFAKTKEYVFYKPLEDIAHEYSKDKNPADIKVGVVLNNKYELLRLIGEGGTVKVYLAVDKRLNKMWAVKVTKTDMNNNSNFVRETVLKEAQTVKLFDNPAIPKIVDIIVDSKYIAVVQDYVEGETLKYIIENYGAQPAERVVDWAKQICDVLCYLHSFKPPYIYRDMKPGNLILEPHGAIKLIDFGIIRQYDLMKDRDTCFLGTKGYAAPEQYGGRGQSDARTDIYGIGMTVYHLLTGIDPKEVDFAVNPICQVNPSLPKGLEYIVEKCTQLDPNNRYQSCTELMSDLNRYEQLPPKKSFFNKIFKH